MGESCWRRAAYATGEEIAAAEKINSSCVSRFPRLTLLAPEIVEASLDGRQPAGMEGLMRPAAVGWYEQQAGLIVSTDERSLVLK